METTSRRQLMCTGSLLGATFALSALARPGTAQTAPDSMPAPSAIAPADAELLTLGLRIERLLAAYYSRALSAQETRSYLAPNVVELARAMAQAQNANVAQIEGMMTPGSAPAVPQFRFPNQALVSPVAFSWLGHTLEEVAIGAHLSLLPRLSTSALRGNIAALMADHSSHAALLRAQAGFDPAPRYFESPIALDQVQGLLATYGA